VVLGPGYSAGSQYRGDYFAFMGAGRPGVVPPGHHLALTGSNLLSVKNYGEFEFWLALCKVVAILAFIVLGAVAITGFYPYAEVSGISRLWDHGGFMPNGFGAVLSAMLITMFSFMGAEIVTIAAAESDTRINISCAPPTR
jgi:L-asparagine transporter-like permease